MALCKLKICEFVVFKFHETFWKKKMLPNLVAFFKPGSEEELVARGSERELRQWSKEVHVKIKRLLNELLKS